MATVDASRYERLYEIQDRVLAAVRDVGTEFYLTGGTCLHRFHLSLRYSDDLDFFTSEAALYRDDLRLTLDAIAAAGLAVKIAVDSRDFFRILVEEELQVDFVNDRVYRSGRPELSKEGYRIDNLSNILSNKVCAITGRDEAKDAFDLWAILSRTSTDPGAALAEARKKCEFSPELLEFRLREFPVDLLQSLAIPERSVLTEARGGYAAAAERLIGAGS